MITDFLWNELQDIDVGNMGFQEDGASCHSTPAALNLLDEKFDNRRISKRGHIDRMISSPKISSLGVI